MKKSHTKIPLLTTFFIAIIPITKADSHTENSFLPTCIAEIENNEHYSNLCNEYINKKLDKLVTAKKNTAIDVQVQEQEQEQEQEIIGKIDFSGFEKRIE